MVKKKVQNQVTTSGNKKHDWDRLKQEFLKSTSPRLADFARENGLNENSGNFKRHTSGWTELRARMRHETFQESKQGIQQTLKEKLKNQWRKEVENCLELLEKYKDVNVIVDDSRDLANVNRAIESKARTLQQVKGFLEELEPLTIPHDANPSYILETLMHHFAEQGNAEGVLKVGQVMAGLKILEKGFNFQMFADLAKMDTEE